MPSLKKFTSALKLARTTAWVNKSGHSKQDYQTCNTPGSWPTQNDSELSFTACPAIQKWLCTVTPPTPEAAEKWSCAAAIRDLDWSRYSDEEARAIAMSYDGPQQQPHSPTDSAVSLGEIPVSFRAIPGTLGDIPISLADIPTQPHPYIGKGKGRAVDIQPTLDEADEQLARKLAIFLEQERLVQEALDHQKAVEIQAQVDREAEEERLAAARARERDCNICGDTMDKSLFPIDLPTSKCTHQSTTCTTCLQTWLSTEISSKGADNPITCPECPSPLTYTDIQRHASSPVFESYDKLCARQALTSLPDFAWCLAPNCNSGQLNIDNNDFMECAACHYKQCLTHKCAWHSGETCAQYDYRTSGQQKRDEERQTEAVLDSVSKKCPGPGCGWRIQKVSGCDHMTCRRCRYEFCWVCLASQERIRKEGNTAHERTCDYHSERLAVTWPFNMH